MTTLKPLRSISSPVCAHCQLPIDLERGNVYKIKDSPPDRILFTCQNCEKNNPKFRPIGTKLTPIEVSYLKTLRQANVITSIRGMLNLLINIYPDYIPNYICDSVLTSNDLGKVFEYMIRVEQFDIAIQLLQIFIKTKIDSVLDNIKKEFETEGSRLNDSFIFAFEEIKEAQIKFVPRLLFLLHNYVKVNLNKISTGVYIYNTKIKIFEICELIYTREKSIKKVYKMLLRLGYVPNRLEAKMPKTLYNKVYLPSKYNQYELSKLSKL